MDYEKKYNEALGWMRSVYPTLTGSAKEDAEHYFPELRESEDERIRKAIVHLLEVASEAYLIEATGFKKERFLYYLEKQKEQKPAKWSEEDEKMLANTIFKLAGFMGNEKNLAWLKSLRPRSSWKPSEEDLEIIPLMIAILKQNYRPDSMFGRSGKVAIPRDCLIARLESLDSHINKL